MNITEQQIACALNVSVDYVRENNLTRQIHTLEDLLQYKTEDDAKRQAAFQKYLQEAHELGLNVEM